MNKLDCICEYNLDIYVTAVGGELKWCKDCGSFRLDKGIRSFPKRLKELGDVIAKLEKKVQELEDQFEEAALDYKDNMQRNST